MTLFLPQEPYEGAAALNELNGSDSETDEDDDEAHYDHADDMESSEEEAEKVTVRVSTDRIHVVSVIQVIGFRFIRL